MSRTVLAFLALVAALALAASAAASQHARTLTGTVGPGFTIKMDAKTAKAGAYVITIKDLSGFHNFHLVGPGVNKSTSVSKQGTTKWKVTLKKGTYRYWCDPHRTTMKGKLVVS